MSTRARRLLRAMPYCMSLTQRMRVFEHLVKADKQRHQPENTPGVPIRVRRYAAEEARVGMYARRSASKYLAISFSQ